MDTGRAGRLIKPLNTYSKPTAVFIWRSLKRNNEPNRLIRNNTQRSRHKRKKERTMTEPQYTKQALSPEVDQAIRRIEYSGASLSAQAYSYRKSGASNRNRPLLAKDLLRLIERVEEAGKVFRSVAKIAK